MSSLSLDQFRAATKRQGPLCTVAQLRESLDAADVVALDAALEDQSIPSTAIARVLGEAGHPIRAHTVQNHRRGDCRCGKAEA